MFDEDGIVGGAMHVVTTEAGHATRIHDTADEIVALHPVLVPCAVGEVSEGRLAELMFLELPEILQIEAHMKAHWPVIVFALYRTLDWLSL